MSLSLAAKKKVVTEVRVMVEQTDSIIAADYRGMSVADMTTLRNKTREAGVRLRVVRNTLAQRALEGTQFECMSDKLAGPLILAFAGEEPNSAARAISNFVKENDNKLQVKLLALQGNLLAPEELENLAKMPSLKEARGMLLGVLQASHGSLVRVLLQLPAAMVRLLVAKQKELSE